MNTLIASANAVMLDEQKRVVPIIVGSLVVAVAFAFWGGLGDLWQRWGAQEELSHSYFLPVITGWMLWERRQVLIDSIGTPSVVGFIPAAAGLIFLGLGELINVPMVSQIGFVTFLMGVPFVLGGWSLGMLAIIPLAYLFFMVPPPKSMITVLSWNLQLISSELGVAMIRLFDVPVFLSGNVIHLSTTKLEVVEACSGLRYLFPFLSLGALAAYFYKGPLWQRLAVFASTVPITIFMNSFRIAMTGILMEKVGGNHTEGFLHLFEGWVVFVLCIAMLFGVIWVFTLARGEKGMLAYVGFDDVPAKAPRGPWVRSTFVRNGIALTVAVLAAGVLGHLAASRPTVIPDRQNFGTLPLEFPEWKTRDTALSAEVQTVLGADDYILTDMFGPNEEIMNLYIAYLDARRDGKSWHSPMQCLPGGGWEVAEESVRETTRADGRPYKHKRMIIQQGEDRRLVYYWYDQRGRKMASEFSMRASVMWDDLTQRRSDGAMVRLMTPILPGESIEAAEARVEEMRVRLEPILPKYVPN